MGLAAVIHRVLHMLSTELYTFLSLGCAVGALIVAFYTLNRQRGSEKHAITVAEYVRTENKNAVSLRRIAELEVALTDLVDSYHALLKGHKKLRARIGMREVRLRRGNGEDANVPLGPGAVSPTETDKDKIRAAARAQGRL